MLIELNYGKKICPHKVLTMKPIPQHWQVKTNQLIEQLIRDDIIEEVHENSSDWVSSVLGLYTAMLFPECVSLMDSSRIQFY